MGAPFGLYRARIRESSEHSRLRGGGAPMRALLVGNGGFRQLLATAKYGEHEDVIIPNAVDDAIAAEEDFADVVPLDLGNDARR
jgi:hypothetical protein